MSNEWIGWTMQGDAPQNIRIIPWAYSRRTALTRYGRATNYVNWKKRIVMPLEQFMALTTEGLSRIEQDRRERGLGS